MSDQHTTTEPKGPGRLTINLGRETAEILAGDCSAPGFYNAQVVFRQALAAALSEQDHPAPSLGRDDGERLALIQQQIGKDEPRDGGLLCEAATDLEDYAAERDDQDDERRLQALAQRLRTLDATVSSSTRLPELPEEAVEALAQFFYAEHIKEMPYWTQWSAESEAHRELWRMDAREALRVAAPAIRKQRDEELRERLGLLGLMLRENQGYEERAAERLEEGDARRLMHEGKASAFRFAVANLKAALAPIFEEADDALCRPAETSEQDHPAPSLGRDDGERLGLIATAIEVETKDGNLHPDFADRDVRFLRDLAKLLSTQPIPSHLSEEGMERLLDDDGPVLLELREAIGEELEGGGFRDEEGDGLVADHVSARWLGDKVSDRVKAVLAASLSAPSDTGGADGHDFKLAENCPFCERAHPNVLTVDEASAVVAAAFAEDHEVPVLDATIRRLGDWVDSETGASTQLSVPPNPDTGEVPGREPSFLAIRCYEIADATKGRAENLTRGKHSEMAGVGALALGDDAADLRKAGALLETLPELTDDESEALAWALRNGVSALKTEANSYPEPATNNRGLLEAAQAKLTPFLGHLRANLSNTSRGGDDA